MEQERKTDVANEPVDAQDDEFMDTGVLHEPKKVDEADEEEDVE